MAVLHQMDRHPANADWTIPQGFDHYSEADHRTWITLYDRQAEILPHRACDAFLNGLDALDLHGRGIPDFDQLNKKLFGLTGWRIVAVPGLVPDAVFFDHLANRRFPTANFIRRPNELDYLQEPDIFHDVFGHVPMLSDPVFADYMQAYGKGGLRALSLGRLHNLARLYWYTVEFGLLETPTGLRIYGAGIVSSRTESIFALSSPSPNRIGFDLERVMRTPYRIDDFQQVYFVVPSLQHLLDVTIGTDFGPLYAKLANATDLSISGFEQSDTVFTRGTQAYAESGGRLCPNFAEPQTLGLA
jgi:phenylalanine-4-hydroxylase